MGGATTQTPRPQPNVDGLSPRGRGNRPNDPARRERGRSIPAWAGQPPRGPGVAPGGGVYPRVGGATCRPAACVIPARGLSPRGRGNQPEGPVRERSHGSIPAWAGQPPAAGSWQRGTPVYPRVGGATCLGPRVVGTVEGLSPRGRGNQWKRQRFYERSRSIPAWAGQPCWRRSRRWGFSVYPRVGGATLIGAAAAALFFGLSPRGRGNQFWRVVSSPL